MEEKVEWRPGPSVCRCCFSDGCYKDISTEYFWMGKKEVYADMLLDTLSLSISYYKSGSLNSNSRLICETCISRLREAAEFRRQVLECEKMFIQHLNPSTSTEIVAEPVKVENVKVERGSSSGDEDFLVGSLSAADDDDDLDDQPLKAIASKMPKKEILKPEAQETRAEKRKSTAKGKQPLVKKVKKKETPSASGVKDKKRKGCTQAVNSKGVAKNEPLFHGVRENAALILTNSNAVPFRWIRGKFLCACCPFLFTDVTELRAHSNQHPTGLAVTNYKFHNSTNAMKVEITDLQCTICSKRCFDIVGLKAHLVSAHAKRFTPDKGDGVMPFLLSGKLHTCVICSLAFPMFMNLRMHINEHYNTHICDVCGKSFLNRSLLKIHRHLHETGRFPCVKCEKVFETKSLRATHIAKAHARKCKYSCFKCDETFNNMYQRNKHLVAAHEHKIEYPCTKCGAVFLTASVRTQHIRQVHEGRKTVVCPICQLGVVNSYQLRVHMVSHTGERNFKCDVCLKAFGRAKTLKQHMRVHSGDRRYACGECGHSFVQNCSLKEHVKKHHSRVIIKTVK